MPLTSDGHALGLAPSPFLIPNAALRPLRRRLAASLPSAYDLRDENKLTPVRNQGACGSCWAFAAMGSLESSLMPNEAEDFSENDMIQNSGYSLGACEGGALDMAVAYLARWAGPIDEADNPYPYALASSSSSSAPKVRKHVQNVYRFPSRETAEDDATIKDAVVGYGAIAIGMGWCDSAYDPGRSSYYNDGSYQRTGGHMVCVVGWNDDYPASNFNATPPGNGAYIVRNSWGTGWGEGGYFYVSYYDHEFGLCYPANGASGAALTAESTDNYALMYCYDPLGRVGCRGYSGSEEGWAANIFVASDARPLYAVSFHAITANTVYDLYVYTRVQAGIPRSGDLQCHLSGTVDYAGYYTLPLPSGIPLSSGLRFSVVIRLRTPGWDFPIADEEYGQSTEGATSSPGQSFVDPTGSIGTAWEDISANPVTKANVCLKAFARPGEIPVTSPAADDSVKRGGTWPISWTADHAQGANVVLQLLRGTSVVKTIANPTPNDGSFNWKVPVTLTGQTGYFVRVKTPDGRAQGDSGLFTITPFLSVDSPASGDAWYLGEAKAIGWTAIGSSAPKVTIQLLHGTTLTKTIASGAPNSGSFIWTLPAGIPGRTDYSVKVKTSDGLASASSPKFTIKAPAITITSPVEGTVWQAGVQTITWTKLGPQAATVNIALRQNGAKVGDLALGAPNSGSFDYTVPADLPLGGGYDVKITTTDGVIKAVSGKFWVDAPERLALAGPLGYTTFFLWLP